MIGVVKILLGLLVAGGVGTTAVVALAPEPSANTATVTHLVDGDTLDVDLNGHTARIRLLNIDTPETKDPDEAMQCLGPEAATYLGTLIPVGTTISLEYDRQRTDRHGRTLAGVFTTDHIFVNAEIARQGLANTVVVDGNDRFYPPVEAARAEAAAAGRGLYSTDVACTLPGQVHTVSTAAAKLATADTTASADLDTAVLEAAAAVALATALENAFAGQRVGHAWVAIPTDERNRLATRVAAALETALHIEADLRTAATARDQEAAEAAEAARRDREAAEAADRDRQVREVEQQQAREAKEQKAREAEARRKQQQTDAPTRPKKTTAPTSNCHPSYVPCIPNGPELDCPQIGHQVSVIGPDKYRLDADGDGTGCDSY